MVWDTSKHVEVWYRHLLNINVAFSWRYWRAIQVQNITFPFMTYIFIFTLSFNDICCLNVFSFVSFFSILIYNNSDYVFCFVITDIERLAKHLTQKKICHIVITIASWVELNFVTCLLFAVCCLLCSQWKSINTKLVFYLSIAIF